MHKRITLALITIIFGSIIFSSYEHGPAYEGNLNRTGSDGTGRGNCGGSGCHPDNDPTTVVSLQVKDASGNVVTHYVPGASYTVELSGNSTLSESLPKFGFQASASLNSLAQAGALTAVSGTNVRVVTVRGLQIAEHKRPLDETTENTYNVSFKWVAPAAGSGNVTFYSILNAVGEDGNKTTDNNNNNDDDDDDLSDTHPNAATNVVLTEGVANGVITVGSSFTTVSSYPNPFTNVITVKIENATGMQLVSLCDMSGREVLMQTMQGGTTAELHTQGVPTGMYVLKVINNGTVTVLPIVKQ